MKRRIVAGCVPVVRSAGKDLSVVLINSSTHRDRLVFPKGGVKRGESLEEGAMRETFEECGVTGVILRELFPTPHVSLEDETSEAEERAVCSEQQQPEADDDTADGYVVLSMERAPTETTWFLFDVKHFHSSWPEMATRQRLQMTLEEALACKRLSGPTRRSLLALACHAEAIAAAP